MAKTRKKNKSGRKPHKPAQTPAPPADPQTGSRLFLLPQELRDAIYEHLFTSTRFTHGERYVTRLACLRITPAPNGLALLRTCRRARAEIADSWLGMVLFSFEDPQTMLDKLTSIPRMVLGKVRRVRITGDTLMLSYGDQDVYYRLTSALALLTGLRLDTLTVLGPRGAEVSYDTLDGLIADSRGWRELRYVCHTSEVLSFKRMPLSFGDEYRRRPQPSHWRGVLERRDGKDSGTAVEIYRSTVPDSPGSVLRAETRVAFTQEPKSAAESEDFGLEEDLALTADGERLKEVLVVAKRGDGADIEQREDSFVDYDIRWHFSGKTWAEIRAECIDRFGAEDEDWSSDDDDDGGEPVEADIYGHVDEVAWPPLHYLGR